MTAPATPKCGEKGKTNSRTGICTRPAGHAGGHLDVATGFYWQAEEPVPAVTR